MVKKIQDLHSKIPQPKPKTIWNKKPSHPKSKFVILLIVLFLLFNSANIYLQAKDFLSSFSSSTREAINSLNQAKLSSSNANFEQAQIAFSQASQLFTALSSESWFISGSTKSLNLLLDAANLISESGLILAKEGQILKDLPQSFLAANANYILKTEENTNDQQAKKNLTDSIETAKDNIALSSAKLAQAIQNIKQLPISVLPGDLKSDILQAEAQLDELSNLLTELDNYLAVTLNLLGHQVPHTYLILIQNNYESRPTGGFFGSMVFAEVDNGVLTEFDLHDIYDYDGILIDNPDYLPPEYKGFNEKLWIRDANYTPDFEISALRIESLLQRANAPSFDTIISIDQTFIENLLSVIGDVNLSNYDAQINAENYFTVLTYLIEANKDENEDDKGILKDFIQSFEKQIFANANWQKILPVFIESLKNKHIQLASKIDSIQNIGEAFGFANKFNFPENNDGLLITSTSIGGNKTDKYIKQRYILNTNFNSDNSIQNTLTIRRHHSFSDRQEFVWQAQLRPFGVTKLVDYVRYILGRGDNVSSLKVYVPNDSKLLNASGQINFDDFSIHTDPDLKQKYYLFKMETKPGQTSEVVLEYEPKIKLKPNPAATYNFNLLSQAGQTNTIFEKTYTFSSPEQKLLNHFPELNMWKQNSKPKLEFDFESDQEFSAVYTTY